jgi:CubicO group peptidase (beta-lactamase class C family)
MGCIILPPFETTTRKGRDATGTSLARISRMRAWQSCVLAMIVACGAPPGGDATEAPERGQQKPGADAGGALPDAAGGGTEDAEDAGSTAPDAADAYDASYLDTKEVDDFLTAKMRAAQAPGMAVAIVKDGRLGWTKGYGLADVEKNVPVTPDTLFMLASISKTVVSVAMMRLMEDPARGLKLDDPIDAKLPFTVRNPNFPDTAITYRMLLTHTSSLVDGAILGEPNIPGDPSESLHDWLTRALAQDDAWSTSAPGTAFSYSNTAVSLAGYLVERITGKNLEDYTQAEIFHPLGMMESSWFLRDLDVTHVAMPYTYANGVFQAQGQYGFADYPDGRLRTSARQLARFLSMFIQRGQLGGTRILGEATVDEMRRVQVPKVAPDQGVIWFYSHDEDVRVLGHNGSCQGVSTDMWFDPATNTGYVLLTNGSAYFDDASDTSPVLTAMDDINIKLMNLAHSLP